MTELKRPLDLDHPGAEEFLRGIQGNIVKGHGRKRTAHVLLRAIGDPADVRRWIAGFADRSVTTAFDARRAAAAWKATPGPGEPFAMFLLAPDGYRRLGFADDQLPQPGGPVVGRGDDAYFRLGMKLQADARRTYNDPPSRRWEPPYQGEVSAMVLLADNDEDRLGRTVAEVRASVDGVFEVLTVERGKELTRSFRGRGELAIEHFGFQDGVSQPIMIKQDLDAELAARGGTQYNPGAPLSLAFTEDPGGGYGSFMVFRKLEQDVQAFWDGIDALAGQLGVSSAAAGALAVGRFENGLPTVPAPPVHDGAEHNDFHFAADPDGRRCPFHAHIRKTNPRGDLAEHINVQLGGLERARRIVRRGITYGDRAPLPAEGSGTPPDRPTGGVGLLFMCFQSNLDQFVIQQEGSDGDNFVRPGVGPDPVIGQSTNGTAQTWPSTGTTTFGLVNVVTMLGGEYFFAPSMASLAAGMPLPTG